MSCSPISTNNDDIKNENLLALCWLGPNGSVSIRTVGLTPVIINDLTILESICMEEKINANQK